MKKETFAGFFPAWKIGGMALGFLMLIGMAACGDKKTEISVTPMTTSILGPAGEMFEVVDKPRTLSVKNNHYFDLSVSLKRTEEGSIADVEWGLELLDENEEVIVSDEDITFPGGKDTLEGIKVGDSGTLKLPLYCNVDDSDVKKITKFRVTSKAKKDWGSTSIVETEEISLDTLADEVITEAVATEAVTKSSSSGEDWDKILDEYEKYCDKAVALYKKAQAGDMSAMTEYASLLESAESLQKKLENAGPNLSAAQAARLNKIAAKMSKAMM